MNSTPVLMDKPAVVFGAGGSIGSAVPKSSRRKGQKSSRLAAASRALKQWQRKLRPKAAGRMPL